MPQSKSQITMAPSWGPILCHPTAQPRVQEKVSTGNHQRLTSITGANRPNRSKASEKPSKNPRLLQLLQRRCGVACRASPVARRVSRRPQVVFAQGRHRLEAARNTEATWTPRPGSVVKTTAVVNQSALKADLVNQNALKADLVNQSALQAV